MGDAGLENYQLGVDVGGTFTDVFVLTGHGETVRAKVPTTSNQAEGIKNGIDKAKAICKQKYDWSGGSFSFIHHGTTTATNAVLEGKGAVTGLIVTAGHKDILSIRRSQIPGHLGAWLMYNPPEPVVALERTVQCQERMSVNGDTVREVDVEALKNDLADLKRQKPAAVAVSLLNSYANDKHERVVAKVLAEEFGPDVDIICSSDVLKESGEYERSVTTAASALIMPVVKNYFGKLSSTLKDDTDTIRVLKSDGGLTSLRTAEEAPISILMSGPAGGVKGAADAICRSTPYQNLITLDVGGTSSDCAMVYKGKPQLRRETAIGELIVRSPAVDVKTVGAGGGSIATYMELTETLRVGPESAGAVPGPACYGKGGHQATVSDANLVLGYLPQELLGGEFELDLDAAKKAVGGIAEQMGIPLEQAAEDIIRIINETMFGAVRNVSVENGFDPRDFALAVFGGAGPMHGNAIGKLLGAWPVIVPPAPGILCAQGDATTKLSHEVSESFIRRLPDTSIDEVRPQYLELQKTCVEVMRTNLGQRNVELETLFETDLRYKGQALTLTVDLSETDIALSDADWKALLRKKFDALHAQQFTYSLDHIELEVMRIGARVTDATADVEVPTVAKADSSEPPQVAILQKQAIIFEGKTLEATIWDRAKISKEGIKIQGPAIISEMDANTLILPAHVATIDSTGNILINPEEEVKRDPPSMSEEDACRLVTDNPLIPTLVAATLGSIRAEMDVNILRAAMSPAIREQQDEFNVVCDSFGKMLVGQFGSFVSLFLDAWKGTIEEGDIFITNDVYEIKGAVSHLNDIIVLLPIFWNHELIGWSSQFGHLTDVGGKVAGSLAITANSVYDDGVQIPLTKLYAKGKMNDDLVNLLCRNSRQPDWYRADLTAIVATCKIAGGRICELADRYGLNVYKASCDELLNRNKVAMGKIIDSLLTDESNTFTDFVDDDGSGVGPWGVTCTLSKTPERKMRWDWTGTSPQSEHGINYYFSEVMFKMFIGYYLIAAAAPGTVVNDGFHDLLEVFIPEGSVLKPVRPAPLSCRTHFLGRTLDVIQALIGMRNDAYKTAAGFSDSPHFFYSGFKPDGEWYLLYQIGFGGVPARPAGDGPDCHCLWPAIKSVPTESIELNFPLRLEANEALPDSGGAGFYRGGNAQRTLYRFLSRGEFSLHDDRWFTKPWGIKGGKAGMRSKKTFYAYSECKNGEEPKPQPLPSKCDHIKVAPGDLLEWITWGGGGYGNPLERPAAKVAREVHRKLVTIEGAKKNYGVIVDPADFSVKEAETKTLRAELATTIKTDQIFSDGGDLQTLQDSCLEETGLPAPKRQWEFEPYGPHTGLKYVQDWYKEMREKGDKGWKGLHWSN